MRRARPAAVSTATDLAAPARALSLEAAAELPRRPTPPPKPRAADRIRDALMRWLEEDM